MIRAFERPKISAHVHGADYQQVQIGAGIDVQIATHCIDCRSPGSVDLYSPYEVFGESVTPTSLP
jgi:hypothetical protein